jgi:hypothetical protein
MKELRGVIEKPNDSTRRLAQETTSSWCWTTCEVAVDCVSHLLETEREAWWRVWERRSWAAAMVEGAEGAATLRRDDFGGGTAASICWNYRLNGFIDVGKILPLRVRSQSTLA